jgi:hypothetical protein
MYNTGDTSGSHSKYNLQMVRCLLVVKKYRFERANQDNATHIDNHVQILLVHRSSQIYNVGFSQISESFLYIFYCYFFLSFCDPCPWFWDLVDSPQHYLT